MAPGPVACFERGGKLTCVRQAHPESAPASAGILSAAPEGSPFAWNGERRRGAPEGSPLDFAWDGEQRGSPLLGTSQRSHRDALMSWSIASPKPIATFAEGRMLSRQSSKVPTMPRIASLMYAE